MTTASARHRAEGWAGAVAAPLFLVAFGLFAGPPTPREAAEDIVGYLTDHRTRIFASASLIGVGSCAYLWYLSGLRRFVDPEDRDSLATACLLCGLLAAAAVLAAIALLAGVVLHVPDQPIALAAFDAYNGLVTIGGFGFGASVLFAATAARRTGNLPPAVTWAGFGIGCAQAATIPGLWVESGPFAPLGLVAVTAFVLLTGWYAAVAVTMTRATSSG